MSFKVSWRNFEEEFKPDDPIYLMTPNNTPNYENKSIMELKSTDDDAREGKIEVQFTNPKTNNYQIILMLYFRFTYIKDDIWEKETDKTSAFQNTFKK